MSVQQGAERQRTIRRRHRRERQAVVFGLLLAVLGVLALGSLAIYTGAIPSPITRDFTTAAPEAGPASAPAPCPPDGTLPVAYQSIQVKVMNATRRAGLAATTATALTERGFVVLEVTSSTAAVPGIAQIGFGSAGVGAAYTLAAQVKGATLVLDARTDATVDLLIGSKWVSLVATDDVKLDPATALLPAKGCVPLAEATVAPIAVAPKPAK